MQYEKIFNPDKMMQDFRDGKDLKADDRSGVLYHYTENIILAVNISLATGRPLLISGRTGCGKSSLAYNIARVMEWRYYEFVINSQTRAGELLWRFDPVRRLSDAYSSRLNSQPVQQECNTEIATYYSYIEPGVLWWAIAPGSAQYLGCSETDYPGRKEKIDPAIYPDKNTEKKTDGYRGAVVLIDEIDKAEPDLPNNLLVPLGSYVFKVDEIDKQITLNTNEQEKYSPLIIITTNNERQLPEAFIRRCIFLELENPDKERLVTIAGEHFKKEKPDKTLFEKVYTAIAGIQKEEKGSAFMRENENSSDVVISIAEYIDTIKACLELKCTNDDELLKRIINKTVRKKYD